MSLLNSEGGGHELGLRKKKVGVLEDIMCSFAFSVVCWFVCFCSFVVLLLVFLCHTILLLRSLLPPPPPL